MGASNISVVIISLNEEDRIAKCIDSVSQLSDDVIVVDSGSTDNTVAISKQYGARVFSLEWKGYGANKNWGAKQAKNDWVLSLDCDEYLSENLIQEIRQLDLSTSKIYKLNRLNHLNNKAIYHSGWHPDWVDRLYPKNHARWNDNMVHERLEPKENIPTEKLDSFLMHHSYRDKQDYKDRVERYAKLKAQSWIKNGNPPSFLKRKLGPYLKYFLTYYIKKGFLDGQEGKEIASMSRHLVERQLHYYEGEKKA